jgi:surface antigen
MARFPHIVVVLGAVTAIAIPSPAAAADLSVSQAQQQLNQAQARLSQINDQAERAQAQLDSANRTLTADQAAERQLDTELAVIARYQYTRPAFPISLFEAGSISGVLAEVTQWRIVSARQAALLQKQRRVRTQDQKARDAVASNLKSLAQAQKQAQQLAAQAQVALDNAKADDFRQQAAVVVAQAQATWQGGTSVGNHFAYGYCTWYVANRRPIPWFGNAIEWWPNARAYGFAEGQAPRVGAVMVTAESSAGHVAYVEAVYPDGSWKVSEMNFVAWGVVSTRTIHPGQVPLLGFIY